MAARDGGESLNRVDRNKEVYLDGADAVEKTTYVGDRHGADVGGAADRPVPVTATVEPARGLHMLVKIAFVLAALALVIYLAGLFG